MDRNAELLQQGNPHLTQQQALDQAVWAWNCMETRGGLAPRVIMFGPARNESDWLRVGPTELQEPDLVGDLAALFQAREQARAQHLSLRADKKIKEALYRKCVPTKDSKPLGTWVWVRRANESEWLGPGRIAHSLDWECSVKIKNTYFSARHEDCLPLTQYEIEVHGLDRDDKDEEETQSVEYPSPRNTPRPAREVITVETRARIPQVSQPGRRVSFNDNVDVQSINTEAQEQVVDTGEDSTVPDVNVEVEQEVQSAQPSEVTEHQEPEVLEVPEPDVQEVPEPDVHEVPDPTQTIETQLEAERQSRKRKVQPTQLEGRKKKVNKGKWSNPAPKPSDLGIKRGDVIQLKNDREGWFNNEVTSRNLKAARRGKEVYNLKNPDGEIISVDLEKFAWRRPIDGERDILVGRGEQHQVLIQPIPYDQHGQERVVRAKEKELANLAHFGTFKEVDKSELSADDLAKMIPTTWAIVQKDINNPDSVKARLCARGDKERGHVRSDSPTVRKQALRLLLTLAATRGWKIKSLDFTGAFLQGQDIDRTVYLRPPPDIRAEKPNIVWKTIKRLYGFKDSGRGWWLQFKGAMEALGCKSTMIDPAMFVFHRGEEVIGVAGVHVDDVLFCGEPDFHDKVIDRLIKDYVVGSVETGDFTFTGWTLSQSEDGIRLSQSHFIKQVQMDKFEKFSGIRAGDREVLEDQGLYRSIVGTIQWLCQVSRPDKAYQGVALASKLGNACREDARTAHKVLKNMIEEPETIMFPALQGGVCIRVYTDSSWGKLNGYETVNGDITFVTDRKGNAGVVDWQSVKMPVPAASPLTGEAEAALNGVTKVEWIRSLARDMGFPEMDAVLITDSKSLCETVRSTTVTKDKRAMVSIANLRRSDQANIEILWDSAERQLADTLTKPLSQERTKGLREALETGRLKLMGESEPDKMRRPTARN